jgi:hypothetical protein
LSIERPHVGLELGEPKAGLVHERGDLGKREKPEMAEIQQPLRLIGPMPVHEAGNEREVPRIGDAGDEHSVRSQIRRELSESCPQINEVFEDIRTDHRIERTERPGKGIGLDIALDHGRQAVPSARGGCGVQLNAYDRLGPTLKQLFPEQTFPAPDIENGLGGVRNQGKQLGPSMPVVVWVSVDTPLNGRV